MNRLFIFSMILFLWLGADAQIYTGKSYEISFFSKTPLENIEAVNKSAQVILSAAKNEIAFKVSIKGFDFEKELMEEHFNEKYMETDKKGPKDDKGNDTYPYRHATFTGKINEIIDYTKDGTYLVTVTGSLTIHNVKKERTIPGTLTIKNGEILIECKFPVALKDHDMEVPSLVAQKLAEVIEVTVKATLVEFNKSK